MSLTMGMVNRDKNIQPKAYKSKPGVLLPVFWSMGFLISSLTFFLLTGCQSNSGIMQPYDTSQPSRTTVGSSDDTSTYINTATNTPFPEANLTEPPASVWEALTVNLYSEVINPNWILFGAQDEEINLRARNKVYDGVFSIAITPKKTNSQILFLLDKNRSEIYPRSQVHGFRFKLNPGDYSLDLSNLKISILGGDGEYTYIDPEKIETLDIIELVISNSNLFIDPYSLMIPQNNWVDIIIWLDTPMTASEFEYILGLQILIADQFQKTIYLDDIQLIISGSKPLPTQVPPSITPTITPTPTSTLTPTPTNTNTPITVRFSPTPTKTPKPEKTKDSPVQPTDEPTPIPLP